MIERAPVLVSACLLGEKVRYDGGDKRDAVLIEAFGPFFEWVRVCPEVDCGLSVPREPMRLDGDPGNPRLVTIRGEVDHSERMARWAVARLDQLERVGLCGYICKTGSPSCSSEPAGFFTRMFMERFPGVPVEEEGGLSGPAMREAFLGRVYRRFRI